MNIDTNSATKANSRKASQRSPSEITPLSKRTPKKTSTTITSFFTPPSQKEPLFAIEKSDDKSESSAEEGRNSYPSSGSSSTDESNNILMKSFSKESAESPTVKASSGCSINSDTIGVTEKEIKENGWEEDEQELDDQLKYEDEDQKQQYSDSPPNKSDQPLPGISKVLVKEAVVQEGIEESSNSTQSSPEKEWDGDLISSATKSRSKAEQSQITEELNLQLQEEEDMYRQKEEQQQYMLEQERKIELEERMAVECPDLCTDEYKSNKVPEEEDDSSTTTKKTSTRMENQKNSYHREEDLEENLIEPTEEDEENTTCSDQTSHKMTIEEANQVRELPAVRYKFNFTMEDIDMQQLKEDYVGNSPPKDETEPALRIRKVLLSLYSYMKSVDKEAKILSWKKVDGKVVKLDDDLKKFPDNPVDIAQFFEGFSPKRKAGRVYIRLRFYSKYQKDIYALMDTWASLNNYIFNECIIQAESSTNIGWIVYSSQFTDIVHLKKYLERKSDFEWGFKMGAITNSDIFTDEAKTKKTEWKNRKKALMVHVPSEKRNVATAKIAELLEPLSYSEKLRVTIPSFTHRYLFTPQEYNMPDDESKKEYKKLMTRHHTHTSMLQASLSNDLFKDLDTKVLTKQGFLLSLRDMILSIRSKQKGNTKGLRVFHSVDFTPDSNKVWFNGQRGPGGSGHIFTFYRQLAGEAIQMIKGLGTYLATTYGASALSRSFCTDHWLAAKGWKWSTLEEKFITPESRQLKANINHDPNATMMRIAEIEMKEEQDREAALRAKENDTEEAKVEKEMEYQMKEEKNSQNIKEKNKNKTKKKKKKINKKPRKNHQKNEEETKKAEDKPKYERNNKKNSSTSSKDSELNEISIADSESSNEKRSTDDESTDKEEEKSNHTTISEALAKDEIQRMKRMEDTDLDSIDHQNGLMQDIHFQDYLENEEQMSVASSLTHGSLLIRKNRQTKPLAQDLRKAKI